MNDVSAQKATKQMSRSYQSVLKRVPVIPPAIAARDRDFLILQGEVQAKDAYAVGRFTGKRGRCAAGKVPVFGILERAGKVRVEVAPTANAVNLLSLAV